MRRPTRRLMQILDRRQARDRQTKTYHDKGLTIKKALGPNMEAEAQGDQMLTNTTGNNEV